MTSQNNAGGGATAQGWPTGADVERLHEASVAMAKLTEGGKVATPGLFASVSPLLSQLMAESADANGELTPLGWQSAIGMATRFEARGLRAMAATYAMAAGLRARWDAMGLQAAEPRHPRPRDRRDKEGGGHE